jgi:hypothetical protein
MMPTWGRVGFESGPSELWNLQKFSDKTMWTDCPAPTMCIADGNFLSLRPCHDEHGPKVPVTLEYIVKCSGLFAAKTGVYVNAN